jgi:hypothetical protein
MKPFFSSYAYFSKRHYHIALLLAMLTVMLGVGLYASPLNVHAATSVSTPSRPPAGFKFTVTPDLSQLIGKDANVHVEILTLSATACAALNQAQMAIHT